jgi:D-amino-acid oxidase
MDALNSYVKSKNIAIIQKKIKSFDEIGTKFIINCSGMGSKELSHDNSMISVQGHLVMLKDQEPQDLQYMALVYFGKGATKSGQAIQRSFYMFPKHRTNNKPNDIGVIGGTFIENATVETPNEEEFDIMLKGAKEFYGIK